MEPSILSEATGSPVPTSYPTIRARLEKTALTCSKKLAIASLHQPTNLYNIAQAPESQAYLRWSYNELTEAVDRFIHHLLRLGVKRGHRIATFLPNCVEYVIVLWAAHRLGCIFVPLNPRTLLNSKEASHILRVAEASVVIVEGRESASKVDNLGLSFLTKITVLDANESWFTFESLVSPIDSEALIEAQDPLPEVNAVTILYTSGTTSLPKGCEQTDMTINAFMNNLGLGGCSENDVFCSVLPNNHAMGYYFPLFRFLYGGAVVYPGPGFDAKIMLRGLEAEKCTHTCLVPTALFALVDTISSSAFPPKLYMRDCLLAGSSISPDNMRQVVDVLKCKQVSTGFGMTEGNPVWTKPRTDPEDLIRDNAVISGTAAPGTDVRICAPDSRVPVPRGQKGEIHQSGPGLVKGYIGIESRSFYHDEDGRRWFVTGDQGVMYPDGKVSITGRYKDMTIRGGENIAPAAIEVVLNAFEGVQAQVVGTPDKISGELPVAVVRWVPENSKAILRNAVLKSMGPAFVPEQIITLQELGLEDFPKTTSGKVQKAILSKAVLEFNQRVENEDENSSQVVTAVLKAWNRATGIPIDQLKQDAPITLFADSIAVMRVRDLIRKQLNTVITADEMVEYPTIKEQISLLSTRKPGEPTRVIPRPLDTDAPSTEDLQVTFGNLVEAEKMKHKISQIIATKGFTWSKDVAEVIPATDIMHVLLETGIIDTWNFGLAVSTNISSKKEYRVAIEKALANSPIWNSCIVTDEQSRPFFVTLRPSQKLWDMCITDYGRVEKTKDVPIIAMQYPFPKHSTRPGPMFHCLLVDVEETKSVAMVMYVHHVVHDASSMRLFYEDIEQALSTPDQPLRQHVSFKAWSDSYQALRLSPLANISVGYHVERLRNLHLYKEALYPAEKEPRSANQETPDGVSFGFDVPGLIDLKTKHPHIVASTVLKAGMAITNVQRTKHTHSVFNNFEAARQKFPFIPPSTQALDPTAFEASDVSGPTLEIVTNLIEVNHRTTAISFLHSMQTDQTNLTKHAQAPLRRVISALNSQGSKAGDMIIEAQQTQFLSWTPGFLGEYEHLQLMHLAARPNAGLVLVGGIGGPAATTYMLAIRWDVANYSEELTMEYLRDLERAVNWLLDETNWERSLGEYLAETEVCTVAAVQQKVVAEVEVDEVDVKA